LDNMYKTKHGATLHPGLVSILEDLEEEYDVVVTDTDRTTEEHVRIYEKLQNEGKLPKGQFLIDLIPWGSRHLPKWDSEYLLAVDINAYDGPDRISGDVLAEKVKKFAERRLLTIGLGIGNTLLHIDIRNKKAEWRYK